MKVNLSKRTNSNPELLQYTNQVLTLFVRSRNYFRRTRSARWLSASLMKN